MNARQACRLRGRKRARRCERRNSPKGIGGIGSSANPYASALAAGGNATAAAVGKPGTAVSNTVPQPVDQFTPGTRHRLKKGKGTYKRPRPHPPTNKLDQDQLQAHHALQKRLDQDRMTEAVRKLGLYDPAEALPLPVTSQLAPSPLPPSPPTAVSETKATAPLEAASSESTQATEAEALAQDPAVINVGPGQQTVNVEKDDGNILTNTVGAVWDGVTGLGGLFVDGLTTAGGLAVDAGTALVTLPFDALAGATYGIGFVAGPPLAATMGAAYASEGSLSPIVGAEVIADKTVDAAQWAAPRVVDGVQTIIEDAIKQALSGDPTTPSILSKLTPEQKKAIGDAITNSPLIPEKTKETLLKGMFG